MKTAHELSKRMHEVILSGKWIANTNFKDQLTNTSVELVNTKVKSLNTIAALAQHVHYYINGQNQLFSGGELTIKDKFSFDFLPVTTQQKWDAFLNRFWADAQKFCDLVEEMTEEKLNQDFVKETYGTYHRNIEAIVEHSYYHLGQVVIIKKMIIGG